MCKWAIQFAPWLQNGELRSRLATRLLTRAAPKRASPKFRSADRGVQDGNVLAAQVDPSGDKILVSPVGQLNQDVLPAHSFCIQPVDPADTPEAANNLNGVCHPYTFFADADEVLHCLHPLAMVPKVALTHGPTDQLGDGCSLAPRTRVERRPKVFVKIKLRPPT